jgi:hypothetical protein
MYPGSSDLPYLWSAFVDLRLLARAHGHDVAAVRAARERRQLPGPAYVLQGGTELVAADYFELAHAAGGFDRLPEWFAAAWERIAAAHPEAGPAADRWEDYLSGFCAVSLRIVTPATIFAERRLVAAIEAHLLHPVAQDFGWRRKLDGLIDELDAITRPFATFDRARFGAVTRDRLINAPRAAYRLTALAAAVFDPDGPE